MSYHGSGGRELLPTMRVGDMSYVLLWELET